MSKILRRPMFRGGPVSSYGTGIASGLADGGRVGYNVGGPIYPAGYSAAPGTGITGADVKKMAEKKIFGSMLGRDTVQLNQTMKDFMYNYLGAPLDKITKSATDYAIGTEFNKEGDPFFADQDTMKKIYDRDVMPEATKLSNELIPQISSEDEYEEAYMTPAEVDLRNEQRKKSYIDNAVSSNREEAIMNKDYSEMKKVLDKQRADPYEGKGGGKDASESDFEIPVGVTEVEGEETVDGGALGYKELADSFYESMGAGADERMAARIAASDAKSAERLKKARVEDLSDIGLDIFRRTVGEGKDIKQALGESAGRMIDRPSRSEKEKDRGDLRREKLEDSAFGREEARRDTAAQMAFKDLMQDKTFDFKDLQSEKAMDRKLDMLKLQLDSAESIADKRIIAARITQLETIKSRTYSPGITEKNTKYLSSLEPGTKEHNIALKQSGYANNIFRQAANAANDLEGFAYTSDDVLADGPIYYKDWGGLFVNGQDQADGTYLDATQKEIVVIKNGEIVESLTKKIQMQ